MDSRLKDTDMYKEYFDTSRGDIAQPKQTIIPVPEQSSGVTDRFTSVDNIDDIDRVVELLRMLLEKAWNDDMPMLVDQYPTAMDPNQVKMPMIVYDYYDRRYQDKTKRAPNLMGTIKVGDEVYDKYVEKFECKLQFDICDTSMRSAKMLTKKFENFLKTYIPYLKYIGVQHMEFYEEPKSKPLQAANQDYPRRILIYDVRLETQFLRRQGDDTLNNIMLVIESNVEADSTDGVSGINVQYGKEIDFNNK